MIRFEKSGLLTTVQDLGRVGYQRFGMPVSGAMDPFSMQLANLLVGNAPQEGVLEVTLLGPTIRFESPAVFAICGGDFSPLLNGAPIPNRRAWFAEKGALLELSYARRGARAYIAFGGGFALPPVMGSLSTCIKASLGGVNGRAIQAGDSIPLRTHCCSLSHPAQVPDRFGPAYSASPTVRFTYGPQETMFTQRGTDVFTHSIYTLDQSSDRMGFRFSGPEIEKAPDSTGNIISDGVCFGSIQVTNGLPIVMMADHQTVGGYPKIGCVITADLPLLAQLKPGDQVRFQPVGIEQAQSAYLQQRQQLALLQKNLSAPPVPCRSYHLTVNGKVYHVSISPDLTV